jgi:hypothetical protein
MSSVPVGSDSDVARAAHRESAKYTGNRDRDRDRGHRTDLLVKGIVGGPPACHRGKHSHTSPSVLGCWFAGWVAGSAGLLVVGTAGDRGGAARRGCLSK